VGEHLAYERYHWFDRQVRAGRCPNATTLAQHFEIAPKTAQRAIEFLRDRLRAPLEYDASRKGYRYTSHSFQLPAVQVSQEELLAVLVAQSLLSPEEEGPLAEAIRSLGDKLRRCLVSRAVSGCLESQVSVS